MPIIGLSIIAALHRQSSKYRICGVFAHPKIFTMKSMKGKKIYNNFNFMLFMFFFKTLLFSDFYEFIISIGIPAEPGPTRRRPIDIIETALNIDQGYGAEVAAVTQFGKGT
jgi:hypothetical protein